ncbi:MAG: hypothetical protein JW767_10680 [Thermoleophilia bacterium]|nr:hypothetical protein [Thermoleophilia bacterium]
MSGPLQLNRARRRRDVGAKARGLARLESLGFQVPQAWVLPASSMDSTDPGRMAAILEPAIDATSTYAVRSSSSSEDGATRSHAGEFLTLLDVPARDVARVALRVHEHGSEAVLVQRMVHAKVAGVVFSRNPVTGIKECVIEATRGTAEGLLAGRDRPERWVCKRGEWVLVPDEPALTEDVADAIVEGVERIEGAFKSPIDAEWAWDGRLWWLQARPITTGGHPDIYSSRMARDMLPGIILPLVWSVNGPLMSRVFIQFLEDLLGPIDVRPEDAGTLIHYRFYINVGALSRLFAEFGFPEDSLELLAGMERGASMPRMPRPTPRAFRRLPHMLRALAHFRRYERALEHELPAAWQTSRHFAEEVDLSTLDAPALLQRLDALEPIAKSSTYYHTVTLMIMRMYTMRLRSHLQRAGLLGPDEPLDLRGAADSVHDVGRALDGLADLAGALPPEQQAHLRARELGGLREAAEAADPSSPDAAAGEFVRAFDAFMHRFGHLAESGVNLASPSWSEQPEVVLAMVAARLDAPSERAAAADQEPSRRRLRREWRRASRYHTLRDETSSLYTHTYGQYRPIVLALADRLIETGALEVRDDVFYLTLDELRRVVDGGLTPPDVRTIVRGRRAEVETASRGEPPEVVVGDTADLVDLPRRHTLRGIAASRGCYTGRAVVCRGLDDLERVVQGSVVVVPYSDTSWNALFAHAGAIVAESGGMLCHSAILAREFGVPAVVCVRGALTLDDGAVVTVDGFHGTVSVLEAGSEPTETRSPDADPS